MSVHRETDPLHRNNHSLALEYGSPLSTSSYSSLSPISDCMTQTHSKNSQTSSKRSYTSISTPTTPNLNQFRTCTYFFKLFIIFI